MPARNKTSGHHATVARLDELLGEKGVPAYKAATKAGLSINVISAWRNGKEPSVGNLDAVLNVLGYKLAVVPLEAAE